MKERRRGKIKKGIHKGDEGERGLGFRGIRERRKRLVESQIEVGEVEKEDVTCDFDRAGNVGWKVRELR